MKYFMLNKSIILLFIMIFLIFSRSSLLSQEKPNFIKEDYMVFIKDSQNLGACITAFKKKDIIKVSLISGSTILLFSIDKSLKRFAQSHQNRQNNKIFNFDSFYGNAYTAGLSLGIYGFGLVLKNPSVRQTGLKSMEAFVYSGLITTILKVLIGRRRPYGGEDHLFFIPFQKESLYKSLPSGHTTVSFAVSTVIAKSVKNPVWKVFWYSTAGMVGASRIYHNAHWASDVFLGGIIGYTVADFLVNTKNNADNNSGLIKKIHPTIGSNGIGIKMSF